MADVCARFAAVIRANT